MLLIAIICIGRGVRKVRKNGPGQIVIKRSYYSVISGVDMKVKQAVESIKLNSNLLRRDADKIHEFLLANVKV